MKRLLVFLICLALIFSAAGALAAGVVIFSNTDDDGNTKVGDIMQYATYTDGTAYVFTIDSSGFLTITDTGEKTRYTWEEGTVTSYGEDILAVQSAAGYDGTLYVLLIRMRQDVEDNTTRIRGAFLYDVVLDPENLTAGLGERVKLDLDDMVEEYDGNEYFGSVMMSFIQDGKFVFTTFNSSGNHSLMVCDMESGDCEMMEIENFSNVAAYKDGMALIQTTDMNSSPAKYAFASIDLNTGEVSMLVEKDMPDAIYPTSFFYDAKTDKFYYRYAGELWVAEGVTIDKAKSIGVASGYGYSLSQMAFTNDGYLLIPESETIIKYNADPDARAERTIRVMEYGFITEQSALTFGEKHPEIEVIRDPSRESIVEAMMNRSGDIAVYCVGTETSDFMALYNRGFMADLSSSAVISEIVGKMYPTITQSVIKDGKLMALPINIYTPVMGYYPHAFEAIGLTRDDAPTTWVEFFEMLKNLTNINDEYSNVTVFEQSSTPSEMRQVMIENLLSSYLLYMGSSEAGGMSFDSPILREILNAFDQVDFDEMEFPEDGGFYFDSDEKALFTTWAILNVSAPFFDNGSKPLVLALSDDIPPLIQSEVTVMFVNPFYEDLELAIEFVECAVSRLDKLFITNTCPDENEPIESSFAESFIEEMNKALADMEKALEKADDDNAIVIESNIKLLKTQIEEFEARGKYDATAQSIADYRKYADFIRASTSIGIDIKDSPEMVTAIRQYADRAINADAFIRNIDQRLRMMMLEGA